MEELDWEGSEDEHPAQEAPHEEGGDDEGLAGLEGLHSGQAAEQSQQLQRAGSMTPPGSPERAGGAANGGAAAVATAAATTAVAAAPANGEAVPEEWQVMEIPEEWRPRPMVRVWGLPAAAQEEELAQLLEATLDGQGASVRSVVFDPRQTTAAGKVALVRFEPPPLPEEGAAEPDAGKVAEKLIAALRAAAPQLHGAKINVEKTGAEVCLFLSNLPGDAESDEGLRAACATHGALERCFVMRNPAGASKGYAFAEFTLPGCAAACKEAWNKAGEALRPQAARDATGEAPKRVKLQRAEAAPVKTVSGLFGRVLYVDGLQAALTDSARLQRIFSEYGEVGSCHLPRSPIDPSRNRGFAFVHYKHSFAADAAFRALDGTEHEGIGRLLISFSNPVKAIDAAQRPASAAGGAQRAQQGQQQPRADSRQGQQPGQQLGQQARGRSGTGALPTPVGAPLLPAVVGPGGAMGPIILPASALPGAMSRPPPPPGAPPPPTVAAAALQQKHQQAQHQQAAALAQQQAMMQQMAMVQQMAMQQAMMQQAAAAAELQRKQKEEQEKAEAERRRKEEEEKREKARREQEYAQRYFGGLPGAAGGMAGGMPAAMASMAALPGMAGFMNPAALAAMMGMPGMAGALGATAAGTGAGGSAAGTAGATGAAAGSGAAPAAEPAGADAYGGSSPYHGGGGSRRDAGYGASQRGGSGYGDDPGGADPYDAGKGSYRGGGGSGYRDRGYDYGRDAYDDAGYDAYGADDYGSGYGGSGRPGYGGGSRRGGGGGGGGGYGGGNRGGGRSKRDNDYQGGYGGSGYGGGYGGGSYPPKRPRY